MTTLYDHGKVNAYQWELPVLSAVLVISRGNF
jgi:hypothetical protein